MNEARERERGRKRVEERGGERKERDDRWGKRRIKGEEVAVHGENYVDSYSGAV